MTPESNTSNLIDLIGIHSRQIALLGKVASEEELLEELAKIDKVLADLTEIIEGGSHG